VHGDSERARVCQRFRARCSTDSWHGGPELLLEVEDGLGPGLRSVIERRHLEQVGLPIQLIATSTALRTIEWWDRRLLRRPVRAVGRKEEEC
jgi:hypothetical protein